MELDSSDLQFIAQLLAKLRMENPDWAEGLDALAERAGLGESFQSAVRLYAERPDVAANIEAIKISASIRKARGIDPTKGGE